MSGGASQQTTSVLPASPSKADQAVYAALKLRIYYNLYREKFQGASLAVKQDGTIEAPTFFQGLTARRVRKIIEDAESQPPEAYTELYRATPQLFYQRLLSLNHGLVLKATDQTFRRNKVFAWNEPIYPSNLCTMAAIVHHIGDKFHLGVDLIRLYEAFGERTFGRDDFQKLFRTRLQSVLARHGPEGKASERVTRSVQFARFMAERRQELLRENLMEPVPESGENRYRLTNRGFETGLYLDLFLHNIWFSRPVPYCSHCRRSSESGENRDG